MAKKIIVTEKPSVARTFAQVLGVKTETGKGYFENDEWIITWCVGHLITMSYPEAYDPELKNWELETLPFLPEHYKYEVIAGVKEQFYTIKKLYSRQDVSHLYYAGDPAREGVYIQMLVREQARPRYGIDERVVWINSQTAAEIKRGILEAKPLQAYKTIRDAGYMRAIEDYALGINFSRALSVKYGNWLNAAAGTTKYSAIAVGRVMTCVLAMVVERERAIRDFAETPFYCIGNTIPSDNGSVYGQWKVTSDSSVSGSPKLYNDSGFLNEADAKAFISRLPAAVRIVEKSRTTERKSAPYLFNLAELQAECSKRFKMSPDETLAVAQSLYEARLTTYPRTDARVLSTAIAKEIGSILRGLESYALCAEYVKQAEASEMARNLVKSRYTDDSKVSDHYAIIPTGENLSSLNNMDARCKSIYDLIVRRFLSIFMPPAEYTKAKIVSAAGKEMFTATASELTRAGYLALYGKTEEADEEENESGNRVAALMSLEEGRSYPSAYTLKGSKTQPPKRYTSGSMILAMENAGQLIEDTDLRAQIKSCGIGTSATRAATIEKLVSLDYINLNKKTQVLTPGTLGDLMYEIVNATIPSLLRPEMTASWERGLAAIESGKVTSEVYREKLENYIRTEIERLKGTSCDTAVEAGIAKYAGNKGFKTVQRSRSESWKNNGSTPKGTYAIKAQTYIDVPFGDKDRAKALGARFDMTVKCWYVPEGVDVEQFGEWGKLSKEAAKKLSERTSLPASGSSGQRSQAPKIFINVPFEDKDEAKALGARFDGETKQWYYLDPNNAALFKKWA